MNIRICQTNSIWHCGMIFLRYSHLTGLRLGGMLHITNIHATVWALFCIAVIFARQPTHFTPLHPKHPPKDFFSTGHPILYFLFTLQASVYSSYLPLGELKVKVEIPGPHKILLCPTLWNTLAYVHACAPTHTVAVIMQKWAWEQEHTIHTNEKPIHAQIKNKAYSKISCSATTVIWFEKKKVLNVIF